MASAKADGGDAQSGRVVERRDKQALRLADAHRNHHDPGGSQAVIRMSGGSMRETCCYAFDC